jgi:acid phosphatase family membrane protein YuiD
MGHDLPIWIIVLLCGAVTQLTKLLVYSGSQRRLALSVIGESVGLPSLHASVLTCLTIQVGFRAGWGATETALSFVFAVIVIHDAIRLKSDSLAQRMVLYNLVQSMPDASRLRSRSEAILNVRAHHPLHVATGALFGLLFAMAYTT